MVYDLDQESFYPVVASEKVLLVMFYAPWCPHSQALEHDFGWAADELADWGIASGQIDSVCSTKKRICNSSTMTILASIALFCHECYGYDLSSWHP